MQQTFLYSYGKVVLENNNLYIRRSKFSVGYGELWLPWLALYFLLKFLQYLDKDVSPKRNVGVVITGFLVVCYFVLNAEKIYEVLFRRSFANRIPLKAIVAYRKEDDPNGLDVLFFLGLQSGRERKIIFRKMENEHERLGGLLSQYLASPKFA